MSQMRASNVHRRAACPGSARLEAGLLDEEDSVQSREGTLLHAYRANPKLERAVLSRNQQDLLNISDQIHEFVFSRVSEQFGVAPDEHFEEGCEKELWVHRDGEPEIPGHCDRWRRYPALRLVVIVDDKFGYKPVVPASLNPQLRCYAVAAADEWPDTERICVAISQPRLSFFERCTMALYGREEVEASRAELFAILDASREPDAPLHAGESQCQYCLAKTRCPEFTKQLVPLDQGKELENRLPELTPEQRDGLIRAVKFADYIKEPLMDHERAVIEAGGESLYALGKAQETREVTDTRKAVALLSLRGDLTREEALDCCTMHFGALEGKVRKKIGGTWKDTKERVNATLESVVLRGHKRAPLTRKKEEKLLK
jgi:hypothetical protein